MGSDDHGDVLQSIGAFILAFAALALAGWLEANGHSSPDWLKGVLVAATTYFFSRRVTSTPRVQNRRRDDPPLPKGPRA